MDYSRELVYTYLLNTITCNVLGRGFFKDNLAGINIEAEYALIKQKKSTLSANMRALVVRRVEGDQDHG